MSPLPSVTCPNCRISASLDVFLAEDSVRAALDAVIDAHPAGDTLIKPMLRYIGLFAPAKSKMAYSRMANLIGEITPAMRAAEINRNGRTWPAPTEYWRCGFETVLAQAHNGKLSLPLTSHGYLLEIIARMSDRAEAKQETRTEQQRAGHAGVGTTPERAAAPVTVHEPKGAMPPETRTTLKSLTQHLRQYESKLKS